MFLTKKCKFLGKLILLDGCASCSKGGAITELRVTHFEEEGGFFSMYREEKEFEAFRIADILINIGGSKLKIQDHLQLRYS
uniref:Uncharacterized protein n=1 Tax=Meloidogyne enterolobii TaxID=390850 RepID=A0A6V7X4D2_MELEN|nr:unnamed protein product [Meloidogyne enterolobii]